VDYLIPVAFALTAWWLGTLLLMHRSMRAKPRCVLTMAWISVLGILGVIGLYFARDQSTPIAAYIAFCSSLAIWAWHEMSYFLGFITGPRAQACPPDQTTSRRFLFGVKASLYHELAIVLTAVLIIAFNQGAPNWVGTWTFLILWWMRWSAKLNIFLGVRNLHQEFWPQHLQYLGSYVREASMNRLFPVSMLLAALGFAWLLNAAYGAAPESFERTGYMLLATLLALASLEHIFLVIRVPDAVLWRWAMSGDDTGPHALLSADLRSGSSS